MQTPLPPKGGAVVSYFKMPPSPPPPKKRTDQLYAVSCDYGDPLQAFTFTGSLDGKTAGTITIATPTARCVDTDTSSVNVVKLAPCVSGKKSQLFTHTSNGAFESQGTNNCLDLYGGGVGSNIDVYGCNNLWNQLWSIGTGPAATAGIQELADGKCLSDSLDGQPGLAAGGSKGVAAWNAWVKVKAAGKSAEQ